MDLYSSGYSTRFDKIYYTNKATGKPYWGRNTYQNSKLKLPQGWTFVNNVYTYTGNGNTYSPKLSETPEISLIREKYENLEELPDPRAQQEMFRRLSLFISVARILGIKHSNICDENLEYLAKKYNKNADNIIRHIEEEEKKALEDNAEYTALQKMKNERGDIKTDVSIRELVGLNLDQRAATIATTFSADLVCPITEGLMVDPVEINSGHSYERVEIEIWLQTNNTCPLTREPITSIIPNLKLRSLTRSFVEMYNEQRGEIWNGMRDLCDTYKKLLDSGRSVYNPYTEIPPEDETLEKQSERLARIQEIENQNRMLRVAESIGMEQPSDEIDLSEQTLVSARRRAAKRRIARENQRIAIAMREQQEIIRQQELQEERDRQEATEAVRKLKKQEAAKRRKEKENQKTPEEKAAQKAAKEAAIKEAADKEAAAKEAAAKEALAKQTVKQDDIKNKKNRQKEIKEKAERARLITLIKEDEERKIRHSTKIKLEPDDEQYFDEVAKYMGMDSENSEVKELYLIAKRLNHIYNFTLEKSLVFIKETKVRSKGNKISFDDVLQLIREQLNML